MSCRCNWCDCVLCDLCRETKADKWRSPIVNAVVALLTIGAFLVAALIS